MQLFATLKHATSFHFSNGTWGQLSYGPLPAGMELGVTQLWFAREYKVVPLPAYLASGCRMVGKG